MQKALLAGTLQAVCVAISEGDAAPHEAIVIRPSISPRAPSAPSLSWDLVEDSLRGALLKIQHLHHALPLPTPGATLAAGTDTLHGP